MKAPTLTLDGLRVAVRILDRRYVFGRWDVLVEPVAGSGQKWVQEAGIQQPRED